MGIFLRRGPAPKLGRLDFGSIIKLNESGSPVEFYVAKHDYEPELNGSGRTLLVRKDCYDTRIFGSNNDFSGSSMDTWLNNTWLNLLDADVRAAISETTFYYTIGGGSKKTTTLQRAVFLLSLTELGHSTSSANKEGTALNPVVCTRLAIAYLNGSATYQWTRSPRTNSTNSIFYFAQNGTAGNRTYSQPCGSRPAFTLPSDFIVTSDMLA